jgi:hypothetical protein
VLFGNFLAYQPQPWTEEEANGTDLAVAQEIGVSIVIWGSASESSGREWRTLPAEAYLDNRTRDLTVTDIMVPNEGSARNAAPYVIGTESGNPMEIGEIQPRVVYYFTHLGYIPDPEMVNMETVLFEAINRAIDPDFTERMRREMEEASARAFATLMAGDPERRLRERRNVITQDEQQIAEYEEAIIRLRSTLDLKRREVDAILNTYNIDPENYRAQWNRIKDHPLIEQDSLTLSERQVRFTTKSLDISGDRGSWPLGVIQVTINLENHEIRIQNLTNRRQDRDHPHVVNGRPCWGGYNSEVIDYIQNGQIAALIEFLFGYLQSYNPDDDWGRNIRRWEEAAGEAVAQ